MSETFFNGKRPQVDDNVISKQTLFEDKMNVFDFRATPAYYTKPALLNIVKNKTIFKWSFRTKTRKTHQIQRILCRIIFHLFFFFVRSINNKTR